MSLLASIIVYPGNLLSLLEVQVVQQLQALLWRLSFLPHQQGQGHLEDQRVPGVIQICK